MSDEHGLLGPPKTANYRPSFVPGPEWATNGVGLFNNRVVDDMRRDPQVSLCLGYKKSIVFTAEFEYTANSPEVQRFVEETHQRFWRKGLPIALEKLSYGYTGAESMYRLADGKYQWDYLKPIYPSDVMPWTVKGKLVYLTVGSGLLSVLAVGGNVWNANREKGEESEEDRALNGCIKLRAATSHKPGKGLWFVHDNIYSQWFGRSCLAPAWTPWRWKNMPDGANEIIAKWYFRHSFSGMEVRYPNATFEDETTGRVVSGQEYARQLATMTKAGASITLPSDFDENGHPLWEIKQYAKIEGSASNLLEWVNAYLDIQIQRAIDIPDELITHQGNGLPLDAPILTPNGWKPIGELSVGDAIVDPEGADSTVTGVYPQGVRPVHRITFSDGSVVVADDQHRWRVHVRHSAGETKVLTTSEMIVEMRKGYRLFLPQIEPVLVQNRGELPLDPYLVGLLLGDGGLTHDNVRFTSADEELVDSLRQLVPAGATIKQDNKYDYTVINSKAPGGRKNSLKQIAKRLGMDKLSYAKEIPEAYLWASVADRIALLQGLMDTDGSVEERGYAEYCTTSKRLAEQVQHLIQSLGGKVAITRRTQKPGRIIRVRPIVTARPYYVLRNIRFPLFCDINPFRMQRKADRWASRIRQHVKNGWGVKSIEPCGEQETVCISVSAPSSLYFTEHFIPTHNTGGYSRSQVSLTTFLQGSDRLVDAVNDEFDDQVMRGLVYLNFGPKAKYRIKPKSFVPKEQPQPGMGGPLPGGIGGAPALPGAAAPALPAPALPTGDPAAAPPVDPAANPLAGLFGAPDAGAPGAEAAAMPAPDGAGADEPLPTDTATAAPAPDEEPAPPAAATGGSNQAESVQGQDMRQTVGGLNAVKGLQESYYAGKMPRAAVIANVKLLFGFTDEEASGLFPDQAPENAAPVEGVAQLAAQLSWTAVPIQHKDGTPGVKAVNERGRELYGRDAERVLAHQADLLRRATLRQKPSPVSKGTLDELGQHIDAANADRDAEYAAERAGLGKTGEYKEPLAATAPGGRKPLEETGPHQALEETGENAKPELPGDDGPTDSDLKFELDDDAADDIDTGMELSPETQAAFDRDFEAIMRGERPEETKYFAPRGGAKIKGQRFEPGAEIPADVVAKIPLKKRKLLDVKTEPVTFKDVAKKAGGSAFKAGAHALHGLNKIAKQGLRVVKGDESLAHAAKRTAQKVGIKYQRLEQRYGRAAALAMAGAYVGSWALWGTNPALAAMVAPEPMAQLVGIAEGIKRAKGRLFPKEVELSQFRAWLAERKEAERGT